MTLIRENIKIEIKNNKWLDELAKKCLDRFFVKVKPFWYGSETYCWIQKSNITWIELDKNISDIDSLSDEYYFKTKKECLDYIKQIIEEDINILIFEERE